MLQTRTHLREIAQCKLHDEQLFLDITDDEQPSWVD